MGERQSRRLLSLLLVWSNDRNVYARVPADFGSIEKVILPMSLVINEVTVPTVRVCLQRPKDLSSNQHHFLWTFWTSLNALDQLFNAYFLANIASGGTMSSQNSLSSNECRYVVRESHLPPVDTLEAALRPGRSRAALVTLTVAVVLIGAAILAVVIITTQDEPVDPLSTTSETATTDDAVLQLEGITVRISDVETVAAFEAVCRDFLQVVGCQMLAQRLVDLEGGRRREHQRHELRMLQEKVLQIVVELTFSFSNLDAEAKAEAAIFDDNDEFVQRLQGSDPFFTSLTEVVLVVDPTAEAQSTSISAFPFDKLDIDWACSSTNYLLEPTVCEDVCVPQFFKCCDPFGTYSSTETITNVTFLEGFENWQPESGSCSFDTELRGCMSYSQCQVIAGTIDAAPGNLPDVCSLENIAQDPEPCTAICRPLECCYSPNNADSCLAENLQICMAYAPCQNLRTLNSNTNNVLETAPRVLDFDCYWQQPTCTEFCEKAKSCGDPNSRTLQENFMACLTYAPCNDVTSTHIRVAPQFNTVSQPPSDLVYACNATNAETVVEPMEQSCQEYCAEAACCWDEDIGRNCFFEDPLGCLAWEAQCQGLRQEDGPANAPTIPDDSTANATSPREGAIAQPRAPELP